MRDGVGLDVTQTYCAGHFARGPCSKSSRCTLNTSTLCVDYISIQKRNRMAFLPPQESTEERDLTRKDLKGRSLWEGRKLQGTTDLRTYGSSHLFFKMSIFVQAHVSVNAQEMEIRPGSGGGPVRAGGQAFPFYSVLLGCVNAFEKHIHLSLWLKSQK